MEDETKDPSNPSASDAVDPNDAVSPSTPKQLINSAETAPGTPLVAESPQNANSGADGEKAAKIAAAKARVEAAKASTNGPAAPPNTPKPPVKKKEEGPAPTDAANHALVRELKKHFNGAIVDAWEFLDQLSVGVERESIVAVCRFLRDHGSTPFNYLSDVTCVHSPERTENPFQVVYNLYSISANERVRLKVLTNDESAVESVTGVWPAANWMEREVYDLFGITFSGHPDLRRLLLPPDWEGHPLRKEYDLEFVENNWTAKHLPVFDEVQKEQVEQRRNYGLEVLSTPAERRVREIFRGGKTIMPLDRK
jgi:NADH-quinone oxidoreductase subunit C